MLVLEPLWALKTLQETDRSEAKNELGLSLCWHKVNNVSRLDCPRAAKNLGKVALTASQDLRPPFKHLVSLQLDLFALQKLIQTGICTTRRLTKAERKAAGSPQRPRRAKRRSTAAKREKPEDRTFKVKLAHLAVLSTASDADLRQFCSPANVYGTLWHASHLCDDRRCFNPAHVRIESRGQNAGRTECFESGGRGRECPHVPRCIHIAPMTPARASGEREEKVDVEVLERKPRTSDAASGEDGKGETLLQGEEDDPLWVDEEEEVWFDAGWEGAAEDAAREIAEAQAALKREREAKKGTEAGRLEEEGYEVVEREEAAEGERAVRELPKMNWARRLFGRFVGP
ncbi:hypothetical protein JCM10213v2_008477 [Rhodosporidiobolus nylandii]